MSHTNGKISSQERKKRFNNNRNFKKAKESMESACFDVFKKAEDSMNDIRNATGVIYDDEMTEHECLWDPNYPESPKRYTEVIKRCNELGLLDRCKRLPSRRAIREELLLVHTEEHVTQLEQLDGCKDEEKLEDLSSKYDSVYFHPRTYNAALLAAGSTIDLVKAICDGEVQNGMAIVRPPGHHAMESEYCGYCFFNNVAISALYALNNYENVKRILIVDWDVHHGQATQQKFYYDPRVLYFSIHRYEYGTFWPNLRESDYDYIGQNNGRGYNFNVPLNNIGLQDNDYLAIFHQVLLPVAVEYNPDLIIISAGYDAAVGCMEGMMNITPSCYSHLTACLSALANGKIAVVLEGGYCLSSLADAAACTLKTLLGDPCPVIKKCGKPDESTIDSILNTIYSHRKYWKCLKFQNDKITKNAILHKPTTYFNYDGVVPEKYPTRDCYPFQINIDQVDNMFSKMSLKHISPTVQGNDVCFVYDEQMLKHRDVKSHYERPERISSIYDTMEKYGLLKRILRISGREAKEEELHEVHPTEYVEKIKNLIRLSTESRTNLAKGYESLYFHEDTFSSAVMAAGSLLEVVDAVLGNKSNSGVAIIRPPGHHAEFETPSGFCIFNNVAVAATYAIKKYNLQRVLIVDWDVHHGNGTQKIFENDSRVLYMSIHRYENGRFFPGGVEGAANYVGVGTGKGFNINIPWDRRGMGDVEYVSAFTQIVLPVAYEFNPQLVIVSAGFDAAATDPLGGCEVTPEGYSHLTHWLMQLASGKVILALEGGYNETAISLCLTMCVKALLQDPLPSLKYNDINKIAVSNIKNCIQVQSQFWTCLSYFVNFIPPHKSI